MAVDRAGAAAFAAAVSASAVRALIACLAKVLSRGAAAGFESHGLFCCAVALVVFLVCLLIVALRHGYGDFLFAHPYTCKA